MWLILKEFLVVNFKALLQQKLAEVGLLAESKQSSKYLTQPPPKSEVKLNMRKRCKVNMQLKESSINKTKNSEINLGKSLDLSEIKVNYV